MDGLRKPAPKLVSRGGAPAIFTLGPKNAGAVVAPVGPVGPVAPVTPAAAMSAPMASVEAANPFASLLGQPVGAEPSPALGMPPILAAFAGGRALLGAFVLAEALALPIALRER